MEELSYENVGEMLVREIPEFKDIFDEYKRSYSGKHLPHVLFGDFTRFVISQFVQIHESAKAKDIFIRSIKFVESLLESGDKDLRNLVAASFLENLFESANLDYKVPMKEFFGPKTLQLLSDGE